MSFNIIKIVSKMRKHKKFVKLLINVTRDIIAVV